MKTNLNNIKNSGYKTPENYFNTLEDKIFSKLKAEDTLSTIDGTGYTMPEGYLDTVETTVYNKLKGDTKVITLFSKRNILYLSGIAAAVLLMFSIFMNSNNDLNEELDLDLVENYIIEEGIDTYEIAALLLDEDLTEENFMINNFSDETIEDYLLNNSDIEELIIE